MWFGSSQVKNIGTDIIKLAKALGVSEHVLSRGNSINEFAESDASRALICNYKKISCVPAFLSHVRSDYTNV